MGPGRRYPASLSCLALYLPALLALLWDRCATIRPKVYPIWVSGKEDHVGREQGNGAALDGGYQYGGDGYRRRAFYPRAGESHEAIVHGVSLCLSRLAHGDRRARRRGEHGGGTFSMLRYQPRRLQGCASHRQAHGSGRGLLPASRGWKVRGVLGVRGRPGADAPAGAHPFSRSRAEAGASVNSGISGNSIHRKVNFREGAGPSWQLLNRGNEVASHTMS